MPSPIYHGIDSFPSLLMKTLSDPEGRLLVGLALVGVAATLAARSFNKGITMFSSKCDRQRDNFALESRCIQSYKF